MMSSKKKKGSKKEEDEEEEHDGGAMEVVVKTLEQTFMVTVDKEETVLSMKNRLMGNELRELAAGRKVRFIYLGKLLQDAAVVSKIVQPDSVIHCVISDMTVNTENENNPEGRIEPINMEDLIESDRRVAEFLQRQGFLEQNNNNSNQRPVRRRVQFRSVVGSNQDPGVEDDGTFVSSFLLPFAMGFIFGFFTLLFYQRLTRKQLVALLVGISLNLLAAVANQSMQEEIQYHESQRLSQTEQLDRFGNVVVSRKNPALRGQH